MNKRHINIPVFVPHLGCPNDCIFCNQKKITGCNQYDYDNTRIQITTQLKNTDPLNDEIQIAFFGGSFTGIDTKSMIAMLEIANEFIDLKVVHSVRISTRPDYINQSILNILKSYNVTDIELGIQSMDDSVLNICERGHNSFNSVNAAKLITSNGFNFYGQMMVGLPGSSLEKELFTAKCICELGAAGARIYPTLVFSDTKLLQMYENNKYVPLNINEAASRCAEILKIFDNYNVPIIRLGLCETDNLRTDGSVIAGPYHPAIGELCENKYYLNEIENQLSTIQCCKQAKKLEVFVSKGSTSKAIGQKKSNKLYLQNKYLFSEIKITEDHGLKNRQIRITVS